MAFAKMQWLFHSGEPVVAPLASCLSIDFIVNYCESLRVLPFEGIFFMFSAQFITLNTSL